MLYVVSVRLRLLLNGIHRGEWDRKSIICNKCYYRIRKNFPDSYNHLVQSLANSRTGGLDRLSKNGKAFIGQWIGAKTLET